MCVCLVSDHFEQKKPDHYHGDNLPHNNKQTHRNDFFLCGTTVNECVPNSKTIEHAFSLQVRPGESRHLVYGQCRSPV